MPLLEVRDLQKWYGRRQVVKGVDFDVEPGEIVGLLGPNGAGKTTSFRMTIGLIDADKGKVSFLGEDVSKLPMYRRARKRRQDELLAQFGLEHVRRTKANRVSGGERRRVEIARCLVSDPKLIMLDEPFAAIDPITVDEIQDVIRDLARVHGLGILLTDHSVERVLEVSDRSYLIHEGRVFASGDRDSILNNADARRHYLGDRFDPAHLTDRNRRHSLGHVEPAAEHVTIEQVDDDEPGDI